MVNHTGAAIDVLNVTQAFLAAGDPLPVLDDVSISASPGQFVALLGPSGCGKSTLLRILAGLDRPLFGEALVDGAPISGPHPDRALMFQEATLLPWRTVRENVALGPQAQGRHGSEVEDEIARALQLVHLEDFADAWPSQLSGGMAQRAALARALVNHPRLLLLDEPLGKLDALTRRQLQHELRRLWEQQGFTTFLVTHDVSEAILLADRIIVFSNRPAAVLEDISVDRARPREESAEWFGSLRDHILSILDRQGAPQR